MKLSRKTILGNLQSYPIDRLEALQDQICQAVVCGKLGSHWQEVSNAIDAEIDRRLGYLPPFWALSA